MLCTWTEASTAHENSQMPVSSLVFYMIIIWISYLNYYNRLKWPSGFNFVISMLVTAKYFLLRLSAKAVKIFCGYSHET